MELAALVGGEQEVHVYLEFIFVLYLGIMLYCVTVVKSVCNFLWPSGHYIYRQFNIQQFYVLPTQCICVFCVDLRTNSNYFAIQH
jgi:hypothetical protein